MPTIAFEDLRAGSIDEFGPRLVTREEIIAFAAEFDPQPMHLDEEAARASMLGGLSASGWHTCALLMRIICDGFVLDSTSLGSPGVDEVRWLKPVRPGDHLTVRRTVLETRPSKSRPDMGIVKFSFEMLNQARETVLAMTSPMLFARRDAGAKLD